jgi:hypothetical protein
MIKDTIADQIHRVRYSPKSKVITVVTVNDSTVVINVLLTYNLQLIYHETVKDPTWTLYLPLKIGFNDGTGLNIFALQPTISSRDTQGLIRLFGVTELSCDCLRYLRRSSKSKIILTSPMLESQT